MNGLPRASCRLRARPPSTARSAGQAIHLRSALDEWPSYWRHEWLTDPIHDWECDWSTDWIHDRAKWFASWHSREY
eukprot:13299347-Alexandrium_andersonii.AAC.1